MLYFYDLKFYKYRVGFSYNIFRCLFHVDWKSEYITLINFMLEIKNCDKRLKIISTLKEKVYME